MTQFRHHAWYDIARNCHRFSILRHSRHDGSTSALIMDSWSGVHECTQLDDSYIMNIEPEDYKAFMQSFLDEAWLIGLRPAHYQEDDKELKATRAHLEDMRTLVFKPGA